MADLGALTYGRRDPIRLMTLDRAGNCTTNTAASFSRRHRSGDGFLQLVGELADEPAGGAGLSGACSGHERQAGLARSSATLTWRVEPRSQPGLRWTQPPGEREALSALCAGPSPGLWSTASLGRTLRHPALGGHILPKLSNSPFRTPPRNACHSPDVNRRTGPSESLLSRIPISPSARLATSTQLPLEKLRELFIQDEPEPVLSGWSPGVGLPTSTSLNVG